MTKHESVINFIDNFKKDSYEGAIDFYKNGYCFHFAIILQNTFGNYYAEGFDPVIMYIPVYNHFATMIDDKLYDITGEITDPEMIKLAEPWSDYRTYDALESQRIIDGCITKTVDLREYTLTC